MAETALIIGAITGVASAAASTAASVQQSRFESDVAKRNEQIERQKADLAAQQLERDERARIGRLRASLGASGVTSAGTPADVLSGVAAAAARDRELQQFGSSVDITNQQIAKTAARRRGQGSLLGGALGTVAAGAQGAVSVQSYRESR